jgi:hypothetical protein
MRLTWRLGLVSVALVLSAPGAAIADCTTGPRTKCSIVADSFVASPNPVAAGQLVTFTATVHSAPADADQTGEAAPDVEYSFEPDFNPGDDPGDVQSATVTSQPPSPRDTWSCTSPPVEPVVCHGPLNATDSVTFKAVYKATGGTRNAFLGLVMTDMAGEVEDFCGSEGGDICDDDDENAFTDVQINGTAAGGGGQTPSGGGGGSQSVFDVIPPAFLGASIKPRTFVVGSQPTAEFGRKKSTKAATGTKIVYTLSEAGTVRMAVERKLQGRRVKGKCRRKTRKNRKKGRCTRYVPKGALTRRAPAGTSVVTWTGRIGKRVIKPGRYRMSLVAVDAAGNRSVPRRVFFRVKGRKRKR